MSFDFRILNGDFVIDQNGDLAIVENNDKLVQDILKIVLTPVGSNRLNPAYGSLVGRSLVGNVLPMEFVSTMASSQIHSALEYLQRLQKEQSATQPVSAGELLAAIQSIKIERNQVDQRFISVVIKALAADFTPLSTQFSVNSF